MMRFLILVLLACGLAGCGERGLERYVGVDLRTLSPEEGEAFDRRVEALEGGAKDEWRLERWWVKPFDGGDATWLMLRARSVYDNPGAAVLEFHFYDKDWKALRKQRFQAGTWLFVSEVSIVKENPLGRELVMVEMDSQGPEVYGESKASKAEAFKRGWFQKQFYAFEKGGFVLVRIEDSKGEIVQNDYDRDPPRIGPAVPARSANEWLALLREGNAVGRLEAMVWISGASRFRAGRKELRQSDVAAELKKLEGSENAWVREYARFTLEVQAWKKGY